MDKLKRLNMLQICDSLFPIGAFALSNGLETYVQCGKLSTPEDLQAYLNDFIAVLPYQDLGIMVLSAKYASDVDKIASLDALTTALRAPMEVRQGSVKLAMRLIKASEQMGKMNMLKKYHEQIIDGRCVGQYSIAVGLFAEENGLELSESTTIYGYSLLSSITTNAVKSVPLRQLDGQRVLKASFPKLLEAVEAALIVTEEEIGIGGTAFEIYSMNHETLYSRLYMS